MTKAQEILEQANSVEGHQVLVESLVKKYDNMGLLEGVASVPHRKVLAACYENVVRTAGRVAGRQSLIETPTTTANVGLYTKTIFPLLRRVVPNLISPDIMSTQPLLGPNGSVFYFDVKRGRTKGGSLAGSNFFESLSGSDIWYSANRVKEQRLAEGNGTQTTFSGSLPWAPVLPFNAEFGTSVLITDGEEALVDDGSGNLVGDAGGTGTINYATGQYSVTFNAAPANGDDIVGSWYYADEGNRDMGTGYLDVTSEPVQAVSRKLRAVMSLEALDDLRALHGADGLAEVYAAFAREIAIEIDRENLDMLFSGAAINTNYAYSPTANTFANYQDSISELIGRIGTIGGEIHTRTKRAPANFIVTTPRVVALMDRLSMHADYRVAFQRDQAAGAGAPLDPGRASSYGLLTSDMGIRRVGTIGQRWTVYQDPYQDEGQSDQRILVGLRGQGYYDAGAAYMPYVPVEATPAFTDPETQEVRQGFRTRYAKKMLRPEYYGVLTVSGVPQAS